MAAINLKHLRYFWLAAKAGGVVRASERLHLTPQTLSGQIGALERRLGYRLFARAGRRLELTEAGRVALRYADEIFTLGAELESVLRDPSADHATPLRVGIADAVPKVVAYRLLEPAVRAGLATRMICREGSLAKLLADLAIHRLDIVLADAPIPPALNVRGFNHLLGECGVTFFATPGLARAHRGRFPRRLDGAPLLLPGEDAAVRASMLRWFDAQKIQPRVVGEFDDSALLKSFGRAGAGIFAAASVIAGEVRSQYQVIPIGSTDEVTESFYAISVERRITHPAVAAITSSARRDLFAASTRPAARRASRAAG